MGGSWAPGEILVMLIIPSSITAKKIHRAVGQGMVTLDGEI